MSRPQQRRLGLALVGLAAVLSLQSTLRASAATQNITLSPTSVDATVEPGSTKTGTLQVINTGDTDFSFTQYVSPYRVSGEDYKQDFNLLPGAPNPASWITLGKSETTTLQPRKLAEITYTIKVPKDTPAGGYYAVIFAQTKSEANANGVIVTDRVGEIFYLTVSGTLTQHSSVSDWHASWLQRPPISSSVRITNDGNTHFLSTNKVVIKDIFGHTKLTYSSQKEVLPHTVRRITIPWDKSPSLGLFKISGEVQTLGRTDVLKTKYILVMSTFWRITFGVMLVAAIVGGVITRKRKHAPTYTTPS